jgi:hypothetical protein
VDNLEVRKNVEDARCGFLDEMPTSLNHVHYLGEVGQKNFNYLKEIRVDTLDSVGDGTHFRLQEKSMVRFVGLRHSHLDFKIRILKGF